MEWRFYVCFKPIQTEVQRYKSLASKAKNFKGTSLERFLNVIEVDYVKEIFEGKPAVKGGTVLCDLFSPDKAKNLGKNLLNLVF